MTRPRDRSSTSSSIALLHTEAGQVKVGGSLVIEAGRLGSVTD